MLRAFVEVNFNLALDLGVAAKRTVDALIYTTGDMRHLPNVLALRICKKVLQFLTFDDENPNSILNCLRRARENARTVREMISSRCGEELNKFYYWCAGQQLAQEHWTTHARFLSRSADASHLLQGLTDSTMSHNEAWHFVRMGRLLERADRLRGFWT